MAAPPTSSAPKDHDRRPSTPLSAVFGRLGAEPAARPAPAPGAPPRLLGFAEPVSEVPPVEDFLPPDEDVTTTVVVEERVEIAVAEIPPPPVPEPVPQPPPIHARVRELPPGPVPTPPPPAPETPPRQNLVGRLGRRLGDEPPPPPARTPPRTMPAPEARVVPAPSARPAPPPAAHHLAEPPPALPQMAGERAGRPSLPRNRRAYRRAKVPAEIEIGGVPCTLIDVSIGGFAASGVPQIEPNALVPVTLRLVIDGIEVGTQLSARIIYVTHGRSAGRFIDLSPSQMAFLRYIVTWRGESVGAVGTTTLLDAIAGGADRGFAPGAPEHVDPEAKSRWWAGLIGKKVNPPR